jgi:phosphoribosylformylglycinamidine synthase subunit PurQ / glutaminase
MRPTTLIIRTAGTNCDRELAHAFELAGSDTVTVHLNKLIDDPNLLDRAELIGFPGGFSYGDDIAAGRIFANRLRHRLYDPLKATIGRGVPIIGVCNGFQVLVKLGILPEPDAGRQTATLADNTSGRWSFPSPTAKVGLCPRTTA